MEVMCIREVKTNTSGTPSIVKVGEVYTVVEIQPCSCPCGREYYVLAEGHTDMFYNSELFAPVDGPDERVILEQRTDTEIARLEKEYREITGKECFVKFDPVAHDRIWDRLKETLDKPASL